MLKWKISGEIRFRFRFRAGFWVPLRVKSLFWKIYLNENIFLRIFSWYYPSGKILQLLKLFSLLFDPGLKEHWKIERTDKIRKKSLQQLRRTFSIHVSMSGVVLLKILNYLSPVMIFKKWYVNLEIWIYWHSSSGSKFIIIGAWLKRTEDFASL